MPDYICQCLLHDSIGGQLAVVRQPVVGGGLLVTYRQPAALAKTLAQQLERGRPYLRKGVIAENHFDLVINLPMRNGGSRAASTFMTQGYRTRRMAVDYSVPLITDVKCTKLLVSAIEKLRGAPVMKSYDCVESRRIVRLPGVYSM